MPSVNTITNPSARQFLMLYWPQRTILRDFYDALPEDRFDFRLTNGLTRKSDSARETLAHILDTRLIYLNATKTGTLDFTPMVEATLYRASKPHLLGEWDKIEHDMLTYLDGPAFDATRAVKCPWGAWSAEETLYLIRDHEILHVGWTLALMDMLDMPRFQSLRDYWG